MENPNGPKCCVCELPVSGSAFADAELGTVCESCKTDLRWAHAWLTRMKNGIKGCTRNHNKRIIPENHE